MNKSGAYKIRPAGRLVLTIGRDLIQDVHAAVVELVKNAYDADSPDVNIKFSGESSTDRYSIVVTDHGHGMTRDDVINKWMVPSTKDKLKRQTSPSGRVMQGRKGVGRYAASVLGSSLFMETVTCQGEKTEVYIDWDEFEDSEFLDDVEILVETSATEEPCGTQLTIAGDSSIPEEWNKEQIDDLRFELRKLKSPVDVAVNGDEFTISLEIYGFGDMDDICETIDPFPIFDYFDYRIAGLINSDGEGELHYSTQKIRNVPDEVIPFHHGQPTECGALTLDIRVYDRDSSSISALIGRGLKDESGNYLGNLQARRLLNDYNGIGVYRNGFRIRPMGDPDFDWLRLNQQRVQNPSLRIGSNQVIGFVQIQSDEESNLIEKSARDGLRDNHAYIMLKKITNDVINQLEWRRFNYRRRTGLQKPKVRLNAQLERLTSTQNLTREITATLSDAKRPTSETQQIFDILQRDQLERNELAQEVSRTVAVYQGQATLGKIMTVVLHEGRRPLNYFKNEIDNLRYWHKSFLDTSDNDKLSKIVSISNGIERNAQIFVDLFRRLDPLASGRRGRRKSLNLRKEIHDSFSVFSTMMESHNIALYLKCPQDIEFSGWSQDIHEIFTNLIENSIYWMGAKECTEKMVTVNVVTDKKSLVYIDYRDTGPGIDPSLIESQIIFEPEFSTKPGGTGIGLAIAGEAAARNALELQALKSQTGAWFRLQLTLESVE